MSADIKFILADLVIIAVVIGDNIELSKEQSLLIAVILFSGWIAGQD